MAMSRGTSVWVLALFAGAANASIAGTSRAEFHATYALAPTGRVVIQNLYGNVEITAWDRGEVMVEAVVQSADPRRINDARVVVDTGSDLVSIHTQYSGGDVDRPASVAYHITVPRHANLENVRLVNGELSISGVGGVVKASSVNGGIKAERLEGEAELSTINGRLEADFQTLSHSRAISLSSVNGAIRLSLPGGAGATISARNLSGGIESEFGRAWRAPGGYRLNAAVNGGGAAIRVHNVNGGISIHSWSRRLRPIS